MSTPSRNRIWLRLPFLIFFIVSAFILFLGFYRNQWSAARVHKFDSLDVSSEGFIVGRLVESRQNGIFSQGALIGMGDVDDPSNMKEANSVYQYDTYLQKGSFQTYFAYRSQNGFQALFFSVIDAISPFLPRQNLSLFRAITSLLTALAIGLLLTWIYQEFGLFSALVALYTAVMSQWLTVFGRNLFWGIWLYFLPFLAVTFVLQREKGNGKDWLFTIAVFFTILLKCLFSGYDFISTAAISTCIPVLYYAIKERWTWLRLLRKTLLAIAGTTVAIFLSLVILVGQVGVLTGDYRQGIEHIVTSIDRRTYGDPSQFAEYSASLQASTSDVVLKYLTGDSIFRRFNLDFWQVTFLFILFSCIFLLFDFLNKGATEQREKGYALIASTWLAFIGAISTYIIFKSASYIHTHLYFIVWHLPFTILGFAMCGYVIRMIFQTVVAKYSKQQKDLGLA